jgi:hypothetical protein
MSEHKLVGDVRVTKTRILGTRSLVVYAAYEPSSYFGRHFTLYTIEDVVCGQLSSRRLPADVDAIAVGPARFEAIDAFRADNDAEAYEAILAAYPEAQGGRRRSGEIEVGSW